MSVTGSPAAESADGSATPLRQTRDLDRIDQWLHTYGIDIDRSTLDWFVSLDRAEQAAVLAAAGFHEPGDVVFDPRARDDIVGQLLMDAGGSDAARGIELRLASGRIDPRSALTLGQDLTESDIRVSGEGIAQVQAAFGLTYDDALARARKTIVASYLRNYLPDLVPSLAGIWISTDAEAELTIGVAGDPAEVLQHLGSASFAGLPLVVVKMPRTERELADLTDALAGLARSRYPGTASVYGKQSTSFIHVAPEDEATRQAILADPAFESWLSSGYVVVDHPINLEPQAAIGGIATTLPNTCTWGFGVYNSGYGDGLVTAGHCNTSGGYGFYPTTLLNQQYAGDVDAERWDLPPELPADNWIHRDGLPDQEITSRMTWATIGEGDPVCHQGANTQFSCGVIETKTFHSANLPTSSKLVQVIGPYPDFRVGGGDSGGPYEWEHKAYGLHSEGGYSGGNSAGVFGAIDFAEQGLGFTVLTK